MKLTNLGNYNLEYYENKIKELPPEILTKAITHIKEIIEINKEDIREEILKFGLMEWSAPYHLSFGMEIRNSLRKIGLKDDLLPDGNWDDYYVQCIEIAVGYREI